MSYTSSLSKPHKKDFTPAHTYTLVEIEAPSQLKTQFLFILRIKGNKPIFFIISSFDKTNKC